MKDDGYSLYVNLHEHSFVLSSITPQQVSLAHTLKSSQINVSKSKKAKGRVVRYGNNYYLAYDKELLIKKANELKKTWISNLQKEIDLIRNMIVSNVPKQYMDGRRFM